MDVVVVANNLLFSCGKSSRILISTSSCFKFSCCFCAEIAVVYLFCLYYLYFIIGALSAYSHCNFFVFSVCCCCFFCFYFLVGTLFCCFHSVLVVFLTSEWPFPVLFCSLFITIIIIYSILSFVSWSSATATFFGAKSLVWFLLISQGKTHQIVCIATWPGVLHDQACFLNILLSYLMILYL